MQDHENTSTDSTVISDILNDFLSRVQNDKSIPDYVHTALVKHFAEKTAVSSQDIKILLTSPADIS